MFCAKVLCQGRVWHDYYKGGVEGIYKKSRTTSTSASKTMELNDKDIQLGDDVIDNLYKRAQAAIRGDTSMKQAFRLGGPAVPCPGGAMGLASIAATATPAGPTASSAASAQQLPTSGGGDALQEPSVAGSADDVGDKRLAMWASFAPPALQAKARPKAKAKQHPKPPAAPKLPATKAAPKAAPKRGNKRALEPATTPSPQDSCFKH